MKLKINIDRYIKSKLIFFHYFFPSPKKIIKQLEYSASQSGNNSFYQ